LNEDFIRPAQLENLVKEQEAVPLGCALDLLCLSEDGTKALGGIPKGCTIAFAGPPGKGKTRALWLACVVSRCRANVSRSLWPKKAFTIRKAMAVTTCVLAW
jgi:hypothetical protein